MVCIKLTIDNAFTKSCISVSEPGAHPEDHQSESLYEELKQKSDDPMIGIVWINELKS